MMTFDEKVDLLERIGPLNRAHSQMLLNKLEYMGEGAKQMTDKLKIGDKVEKVKGYRWPGVIVAVFETTQGKLRYVVECTVPEVAGALHIYAPDQIEKVD